jgi:hypothetical protein
MASYDEHHPNHFEALRPYELQCKRSAINVDSDASCLPPAVLDLLEEYWRPWLASYDGHRPNNVEDLTSMELHRKRDTINIDSDTSCLPPAVLHLLEEYWRPCMTWGRSGGYLRFSCGCHPRRPITRPRATCTQGKACGCNKGKRKYEDVTTGDTQ